MLIVLANICGCKRKNSILTRVTKYVKLNPALHVKLFFMYGIFSLYNIHECGFVQITFNALIYFV